jgi:hypothetical protein
LNFWESCAIKLNANSSSVLALLAAPDLSAPYQPFLWYGADGNILKPLASPIAGETPNFHTYNFQCEDVNGDGLDDIFMSRRDNFTYGGYSKMKPILYMNNGRGALVAFDKFPAPPESYSDSRTFMADLNNDGIKDLVIWDIGPENTTYSISNKNPIVIVKGLKKIEPF